MLHQLPVLKVAIAHVRKYCTCAMDTCEANCVITELADNMSVFRHKELTMGFRCSNATSIFFSTGLADFFQAKRGQDISTDSLY